MRGVHVPSELDPVNPWDANLVAYVEPPPGVRNGRWLSHDEIARILERFGPSYVRRFNPSWANSPSSPDA